MARFVNQGMREYGIALHGTGRTLEEARQDIERGYGFPQIAYMSCGNRWRLGSIEDVPIQNIPCPCGNPNHWLVRYDIIKSTLKERLSTFIRGVTGLFTLRPSYS
jgi:hypothetical protein